MTQPDFDSYITSSQYRRETVTVTCVQGHLWQTQAFTEYGAWFLVDDDQVCPECGADVNMDKDFE